jgi:hypothetical protein
LGNFIAHYQNDKELSKVPPDVFQTEREKKEEAQILFTVRLCFSLELTPIIYFLPLTAYQSQALAQSNL